jgi:hypothetical protein
MKPARTTTRLAVILTLATLAIDIALWGAIFIREGY